MQRSFSEQMKCAHLDMWNRAHRDHPFVTGIGDGSLSIDKFCYYLSQDYLFLIGYCRVVAMAVAKSPDIDSMGRWARLLDETLNSEMDIHRNFCSEFGLSVNQLESTTPSATTLGYVEHLLKIAKEGSIEEISAAMLPCQWGYDEIGRSLERNMTSPMDSSYNRWVTGYCSEEYREVTAWLKQFVDQLGEIAAPGLRRRMSKAFGQSTRQEFLFWESAWNQEGYSLI